MSVLHAPNEIEPGKWRDLVGNLEVEGIEFVDQDVTFAIGSVVVRS